MRNKIKNNKIGSNFLDELLLIETEGVDIKALPSIEKNKIKHILTRELNNNARTK